MVLEALSPLRMQVHWHVVHSQTGAEQADHPGAAAAAAS